MLCVNRFHETVPVHVHIHISVFIQAIPEKLSCSSAGCIAGVVTACFIICVAAAGGGYYIYKEK